jgi:hypothetical protein
MVPRPTALDDRLLVRYLLGSLAPDETERLDELSIADDRVAGDLRAAENDLVDAYVTGALSGETLDRFRSHYLSRPSAADRVRSARALRAYLDSGVAATARPRGAWFPGRSRALEWAAAAALLTMVVATGYLLRQNATLHRELAAGTAARAVLEQRAQNLQKQIEDQRSSAAQTKEQTPVLSLLLLPPRRGVADLPSIAIPPGPADVTIRLQLELDDFPRYRIALKDSDRDRVIWRSGDLQSQTSDGAKVVSSRLPATVLEPRRYVCQLSGVTAKGSSEVLGSYPFRVVNEGSPR